MISESAFGMLSLDGDGIRGLYTAKLLEVFEEQFSCHIVDYFDMICGASTGGLIALSLALRMPAKEIRLFYEEHGGRIFPEQHMLYELFRHYTREGKYSNAALKEVLSEVFGTSKLSDAQCILCLPSYSLTSAQPEVFRAHYPEGIHREVHETSCIEAALATTAAPGHFPAVELSHANFSEERFIDQECLLLFETHPTHMW